MKILFFGDCMFGRDGHIFDPNPFTYVNKYIKQADIVIFNLETVISPKPLADHEREQKVFNYQSTGEQLVSLMKNKTTVIASISNNHSLDYGVKGLRHTKAFLKKIGIQFPIKKNTVIVPDKGIVVLSASDQCGCDNIDTWGKHIWMIDYNNVDPIIERLKKIDKSNIIIFSIHWGSNWLDNIPNNMSKFGKLLIDNGVSIVFGHSAHHIPPKPYEFYKEGLIIYGLGDFVNDYSVDENYNSDLAYMGLYDTKNKDFSLTKVKRLFQTGEYSSSSIPMPML